MLNYMLLTVVVTGHNNDGNTTRPWTYDDTLCMNAAVEINMLDYNVR